MARPSGDFFRLFSTWIALSAASSCISHDDDLPVPPGADVVFVAPPNAEELWHLGVTLAIAGALADPDLPEPVVGGVEIRVIRKDAPLVPFSHITELRTDDIFGTEHQGSCEELAPDPAKYWCTDFTSQAIETIVLTNERGVAEIWVEPNDAYRVEVGLLVPEQDPACGWDAHEDLEGSLDRAGTSSNVRLTLWIVCT